MRLGDAPAGGGRDPVDREGVQEGQRLARLVGVSGMLGVMATPRPGAPKGRRQRGNECGYDITSGLPYRPGVNLAPKDAVKAVQVAAALNMSVSGLISQLVARLEVDDDYLPAWADEVRMPSDEELPLTG